MHLLWKTEANTGYKLWGRAWLSLFRYVNSALLSEDAG